MEHNRLEEITKQLIDKVKAAYDAEIERRLQTLGDDIIPTVLTAVLPPEQTIEAMHREPTKAAKKNGSTPAVQAGRALQGTYMGKLRAFGIRDRATVKKTRAVHGTEAAIRLMEQMEAARKK